MCEKQKPSNPCYTTLLGTRYLKHKGTDAYLACHWPLPASPTLSYANNTNCSNWEVTWISAEVMLCVTCMTVGASWGVPMSQIPYGNDDSRCCQQYCGLGKPFIFFHQKNIIYSSSSAAFLKLKIVVLETSGRSQTPWNLYVSTYNQFIFLLVLHAVSQPQKVYTCGNKCNINENIVQSFCSIY